ncbi:unnamed protein product [Musa acuminata subsp. malaccensis]|uniref:(wild Malaysian banana) hypothetical protein n=1 Tax=Musa acuminata subsp. malaccensis TaxID=214687 RepID=A0A804IJS2_MUSAM|nr:unnamed protein product [Musa acuminata subsp. malaccensis]
MKKKRTSLLPESSNLSPRRDHIMSLQGRRNEELQGSIRSKERLGLLFGALSAFGTLDLPTWSINCSADVPYASGIKPLLYLVLQIASCTHFFSFFLFFVELCTR